MTMAQSRVDEILTAREAAERLGITANAFRALLARRRWSSRLAGGSIWLVRLDDILEEEARRREARHGTDDRG
jgi:1,2-phenylacetyl-CoA epoxidase PaaB subunit